ncbi:MAG TPA: hypothetical protein VJN44_04955 [Roseateles sp.]|nr:hypothetical protein [Roseateles sp.]
MAATGLWPWLAIAGLGALHGLNPAAGWMFAAACGLGARDAARARRSALLAIAIGHAASVALVAVAVAQGLALDRRLFQGLAGALLLGMAAYRLLLPLRRREAGPPACGLSMSGRHAGIALWSFLMAGAQGAGLMLVPALAPLCLADNPAREIITASGSLGLALAAVGIHMAALLAATGIAAAGLCRGMVAMQPRWLGTAAGRHAWTAGFCGVGGLLLLRALGEGAG